MKTILTVTFLSIFLTTSNVFSMSVIMGGFGTDGASGEPIPVEASVSHAYQIYESLRHTLPNNDGDIYIVTSNGEFICEEPIKGIIRLEASCEIRVVESESVSFDTTNPMTLKFGGELASKLYEELNIDADQSRIGASTKTIANMSCTKVMNLSMDVTCRVTDFFGVKIELDEEMDLDEEDEF